MTDPSDPEIELAQLNKLNTEKRKSDLIVQTAVVPSADDQVRRAPADPGPPPDGGLHAWLTVLGASLIAFSTFGIVNSFGEALRYSFFTYPREFKSTFSAAGFARPIFDAYGAKYLIPASGITTSFSLFMLSIVRPHHIYQ
ncbi:hypothetical protein GYMLUDRAFT_981342 [Collybiopsis luxurians FD-317 M1]|uniref:Uncharacterized protein n=1 Tax=Collybiopsis luxurians FD-317 M1 TaxID=944289 RepID=A0A0D0BPD3_9AGAR|nr:hypothetical protein GYMLUDRAFT_981342 [Collybiopsis luxurians FD-317 M1]